MTTTRSTTDGRSTLPAVDDGSFDDLVTRYQQTADRKLRDHLIEWGLPLIKTVVDRLRSKLPQEVAPEDLMQEGVFGLLDALRAFDPAKKVKFATFASLRIRGSVQDYLRSIDWVPRQARHRARVVDHARQRFTAETGRQPCDNELSGELGIAGSEFRRVKRDSQLVHMSGLEAAGRSGDDNDRGIFEIIPDQRQVSPTLNIRTDDLRGVIAEHLDRAERLIVVLYYFERLSMKEIGTVLAMSESRVSQIHSSIMERLRQHWVRNAEAQADITEAAAA